MVDYLMVYSFKILWVGTYRGMGGYSNEYGTLLLCEDQQTFTIPRLHLVLAGVKTSAFIYSCSLIG